MSFAFIFRRFCCVQPTDKFDELDRERFLYCQGFLNYLKLMVGGLFILLFSKIYIYIFT